MVFMFALILSMSHMIKIESSVVSGRQLDTIDESLRPKSIVNGGFILKITSLLTVELEIIPSLTIGSSSRKEVGSADIIPHQLQKKKKPPEHAQKV